MAVGKQKKPGKGRKGAKHKRTDPFLRKEWYDVRTPAVFPKKSIGKTVVTKTTGIRVARDSLMGRIFEVSLGDLKENVEDEAFRKFHLKVEDVQGFNCLTQFWGMSLTTDKLASLVRKWQTLIEAYCDVKTTDGYSLRLFAIGFTKSVKGQRRKTSYAQSSQVRAIRRRMVEIMQKQGSNCDLAGLVEKLMGETIGREIEKTTQSIYPLQNCLIRKVKMLRSPRVDIGKLAEAHGGTEALTVHVAGTGAHTAVAASIAAKTAASAPTPMDTEATGSAAAPSKKEGGKSGKQGGKKGGKAGKAAAEAPAGDAPVAAAPAPADGTDVGTPVAAAPAAAKEKTDAKKSAAPAAAAAAKDEGKGKKTAGEGKQKGGAEGGKKGGEGKKAAGGEKKEGAKKGGDAGKKGGKKTESTA